MNCDLRNRSPRVERQPDTRLLVTRLYDVLNYIPKDPDKLLADVWLDWGTVDEEFPDCRLIKQFVSGQDGTGKDPVPLPPILTRVYDELDATGENQVGEPAVTVNQYGYKEVTIVTIQFTAGTPLYFDPGTTAAPAPFATCILRDQEATDDGTLRTIKRVYVEGGQLDQYEELKFGGKLKLRTLKYLNEVPPTPSGYTLVTQTVQWINGLPVYSYGYASGAPGAGGGGVIDTQIEYHQSSDTGTTGVTVTTIKYISDPTVVANPITTPAGSVLISIDQEISNGFTIWTGVYAKGIGEVSRDIAWSQGATEGAETIGLTTTTITHLTASTTSTNPTSAPAGSTLIALDHRESDGYRKWVAKYAKGVGLVVDEVDIQIKDALVVYHRVALNAAPSTPTQTIGGTVTLFETSVRKETGGDVYDYRWAEGDGQMSITTAGQGDGALDYTVVTTTAAASTPAYPGGGTAYLVRLTQEPKNGYFQNTATYRKPPATATLKEMINFQMPGTATFVSNDLFISPPSTRTLLADVEISYDVAQLSDTPYAVSYGCFLSESYIRTNNNDVGEGRRVSLGYVLGNAASVTGTNDYYNGVLCDEFEAAIASSSPTGRPSGLTVIDVDHDIYLVSTAGTVVFRRVKTSYTF